MEQLCKHRTQGIRTRKASCLSGGTGEKSGALIRNTMEIRRASKKAGVHRKKQKVLSDTRKTRSSLREDGGIEGNTRKSWRNTRKKGRTVWTTPTIQLNLCAYLVAGFPLFPISHRFLFSSLLEKSGAEWNGSLDLYYLPHLNLPPTHHPNSMRSTLSQG